MFAQFMGTFFLVDFKMEVVMAVHPMWYLLLIWSGTGAERRDEWLVRKKWRSLAHVKSLAEIKTS